MCRSLLRSPLSGLRDSRLGISVFGRALLFVVPDPVPRKKENKHMVTIEKLYSRCGGSRTRKRNGIRRSSRIPDRWGLSRVRCRRWNLELQSVVCDNYGVIPYCNDCEP